MFKSKNKGMFLLNKKVTVFKVWQKNTLGTKGFLLRSAGCFLSADRSSAAVRSHERRRRNGAVVSGTYDSKKEGTEHNTKCIYWNFQCRADYRR